MKTNFRQKSEKIKKIQGFTIVELLIVIVVIGILAAIIIVAFNGIQRRSISTTLTSDLRQAATAMKLVQAEEGAFPTSLPADVKASDKVTLRLDTGGGDATYSNLTASQNGLLFFDTCAKLISEGVGQRADGRHYISECRVYSKTQLHVNGWNGGDINTPITTTSLSDYVNRYVGGEKSLFTTEAQSFMNQWASRFQAAGGTFPVSSFWDTWATPTNGGVMKPTMPAPTSSGGVSDPNAFCVEAVYEGVDDAVWHVTQITTPKEGGC